MDGLKSILLPTESTGICVPQSKWENQMAHDPIREFSGVALSKTTDDGTRPFIDICQEFSWFCFNETCVCQTQGDSLSKGDCHCRSRVLVMELARLRWALVGETPTFDLIHQDYSGDWATRTRETGQPVQTLFSTKRCESVFVGGSRGLNTFRAGGLLRTSRGVRMLRGNLDALVPLWATVVDRCIAQACNCNP